MSKWQAYKTDVANKWRMLVHNMWQTAISIDQAQNCILSTIWALLALLMPMLPSSRVWADETFSSRCWRWYVAGIKWPKWIVDILFFWDRKDGKWHCQQSYENERTREQCPPEMRG